MSGEDHTRSDANPSTNGATEDGRAYTLADLQGPGRLAGQWRRVPRTTLAALALVRRAAPRQLATTVALQVVSAAMLGLQLLIGKHLLSELIDTSQRNGPLGDLLPAFGLLIAATSLAGLTSALIAHQQRLLTELVGRHVFDEMIGVATGVKLEAFERPAFYDQLERARTAGMYRPIEMVTSVTTLGTSILTSVGVGAALATIEPLLLPLIVLAALPVFLATVRNGRQAYTFEYAITPQSRERMYLMELLTGRDSAKEVRAFGSSTFLRRRYDRLTDERFRYLREFLRARLVVSLVGATGGAIAGAIALGSLAFMLGSGRIDVASAVAAGVGMQILSSRISGITLSLGKLIESGMFLDDYRTFLDLGEESRLPEKAPARMPSRPARFAGLEVDRVSFHYPDTDVPVLTDVSLSVKPGEIVALVGENGSGKTTLVKLICKLYEPQGGRIVWNGRDVREVEPEDVRAQTTILFQDYVKYHLTAHENIALGRVERREDPRVVAAAAGLAGADGFIGRLPDGYGTRLGRQFYGGHELSIGQWQRLALARAFYRGGDFLVLDEPTASLDARAEHELYTQMRRLAGGRSVLLISHRFSSVRSADRIYVLGGGRITESGSHDELVALGGHYADLFRMQAEAYLGQAAVL